MGKFVILAILAIFVSVFLGSKKNSCDFCDFGEICGLLEALLCLSLHKSRILINLLFLLFLRYLQVSVVQNFLVNHFFWYNFEKT